MRPVPIEDHEVPADCKRVVIGPPGNRLESSIAPVEVLTHRSERYGVQELTVKLMLEDGDLEKLQAGQPVWLTFLERIVPFDVQIHE